MVQQEFMHWQNDFFCSVSHPTNSGIHVAFLTIPACWADEGFGELRFLWHKQPQPVSGLGCLALICSTWNFLPLNSLCCCIWLSYLGVCLSHNISSSSKAALGKYLDTLTCVQTSLLCLIDLPFKPHRAQPMSLCGSTSCSGDTIPFFLSLLPISKQIIYLHKATCS